MSQSHEQQPPLTIAVIPAVELFNRIGGFGSILTLDTRSPDQYQHGHVPRSINVPVTSEDVSNHVPLEALEKKVTSLDLRALKLRNHATVVIVAQAAEEGMAPECEYLASLFKAEGKVRSIDVVQGGYAAFEKKFPFLSCAYKEKELSSGRHTHLPPFPWYPNEILDDFLFLGNHVDAENRAHLDHLAIKRVLNVSNEVDNAHPNDFTYLRFSLPDEETQDLTHTFDEAFSFLDDALAKSERVFVHCHQGISRSATIVFAYLMKTKGWTLKETFEYVKSRRKQVFPNLGFWKQLSRFEQEVIGRDTLASCVDIEMLQREVDARIAKQKAAAERALLDKTESDGADKTASEDKEEPDASEAQEKQGTGE